MLTKRILGFIFAAVLMPLLTLAQVTTSSISGTVQTTTNQPLEGATITATHLPSGTNYSTISKNGGTFNMQNLRIGGPYRLTVDFVGYQQTVIEGFTLLLGQPYNVNITMGQSVRNLGEVVVSGSRRRVGSLDKTGAATNITSRQLNTLPTISRSIGDFTRLTPQASGNSFAGRDARFNNVQIDGANLNNNFGLSSEPLPGGGNQPISLDAIEEISVNIAPFDVRQANFTGAGINAVTKSGTNNLKGSVYGLYRDQTFNGMNVGDVKLPEQQRSQNKIYGFTVGGPIIKNKLFFFANAELEQRDYPGIQWSPTGGSGSGNISSTPIDSLRKLSNFLRERYGYETGPFDNFQNFMAKNHKILGRIDWNISRTHKLTARYNELVSNNDVAVNSRSIPNNAGTTFASVPRFGNQAFSFANSNYGFRDVVRSGTIELNSNYRGKFANQLLATVTRIGATRTSPSQVFPFIDILNGGTAAANNNYMSVGYEPYSHNNAVINNIYTITDNFTYFAGKHTLTGGISYEYQRVGNMFMPASQSYYVFNSLNDFITNQAPRAFALTYSLIPGQDAVYSANLRIGQLGVYVQDDITVNERLKVTAGLRVDVPTYPEQPLENPAISALTFPDREGKPMNYSTGQWPKSTPYFSPRVGFRWDPTGDKSMLIRGGTGIFTGRIPFVYLTNIPTGSSMYQVQTVVTNAAQLQNFRFNPDPRAYNPLYNPQVNQMYPSTFPVSAGAAVPTSAYAVADPNFKFPQIWRTNIAVEQQIGSGWSYTLEALYSKDINAVVMRNANQKAPDQTVVVGPNDVRGRFSNSAARRVHASSGNAIVLENSNRGGSFVFTAQVAKNFSKGFYASLAYNYTLALDLTANPGSQANSVWSVNPTRGTQNDLQLSYSNFAVPHRIVGQLSYRREFLNKLATTVSFFYEGEHQGRYSYIYNGDINNDGNFADLMYIPANPSEIRFAQFTQGSGANLRTFTPQQQSEAFFRYIEQDRYLRNNKGNTAERWGALLPFYHRLDMRFVQDIFHNIGGSRRTLQFTADVLNFANMLNKNWGIRRMTVVNNPLRVQSVTNGIPTYTFTAINNAQGVPELVDRTFQNSNTQSSTWSAQLGLRLIF